MYAKSFCKLLDLEEIYKRNVAGETFKPSSQSSFMKSSCKSREGAGDTNLEITRHIEDIVLNVLLSLKNGEPPRLRFFNRRIWKNTALENLVLKGTGNINVTVDFGQPHSRPHLALIFWLLSNLHHQSISGSTTTKRELYYKTLGTLKSLDYAPSQEIVNNAMSDIGALINLPPRLFGVLPSSRGLVAGDLRLSLVENAESNTTSIILDTKAFGNDCCPIPGEIASLTCGKAIVKSSAQLVLIIEKDATFQKLLDDGILEHLKLCLLITGRGYPDVSTRRLVHIIWECLKIPIMALVDADPHGIEIMLVYRYGSLAMSKDANELAVPSVRWLGVHPSDIPNLGLPTHSLLPLGDEGTTKAEALLTRPYVQAHPHIYKEAEGWARLNSDELGEHKISRNGFPFVHIAHAWGPFGVTERQVQLLDKDVHHAQYTLYPRKCVLDVGILINKSGEAQKYMDVTHWWQTS